MSEKEDYTPYGEEWKREMNKLPKAVIIDVASKIGTEKDIILEQRNEMLYFIKKHYKFLNFPDQAEAEQLIKEATEL